MPFDLNFITSLFRLCDGAYDRDDIHKVVGHFASIARSVILKTQHFTGSNGEWKAIEDEVEDVALDYIAHLFARDEAGVFIELKTYFQPVRDQSPEEIAAAVDRLIRSAIHQASVRTYGSRDPVGRIFYRSLRYILRKYPHWQRVRMPDGSHRIVRDGDAGHPAPDDRIVEAFRMGKQSSTDLTTTLERGLKTLLETEKQSVPVQRLLEHVRLQIGGPQQNPPPSEDMSLALTLAQHLEATLRDLNGSILEKYEREKKLSCEERGAFLRAIKTVLEDFQADRNGTSYFEYLSGEMPALRTRTQYRLKYRRQFEYAAKVAKRTFSANVKSDFNL